MNPTKSDRGRYFQSIGRYRWAILFMAMMLFTFFRSYWTTHQGTAVVPYSEFQSLLKSGGISELWIGERQIRGRLHKPRQDGKQDFVTQTVEPELARQLSQYPVKYTRMVESTLVRDLASWLLPLVLIMAVWGIFLRRMATKGGGLGSGFMAVGKSKARVYVETDIQTRFKDVAGVDEAKQELEEIIEFLKNPEQYGRLGARMPKGILLVGPPGTGKTLLAKAVAGEAGVPFFSISGSEFVEMFVGVGAARVRDLFEQARAKAPCIIFIDELDALGKSRGALSPTGGHDEKEQTLNQLLAELDGFDSKGGVVLLAATNRPEILDPALLRAGRFDRQVLVDRPDRKGREAILLVHMKKIRLTPASESAEAGQVAGQVAAQVASMTPGFTGADLANLVNEAALGATRRKGDYVILEDFTQAIERIVAGLEKKNRLLNPWERKVVAHHEMGHALVAFASQTTDRLHKVSIIPRGIGSLGYTIQRPTEDRYLMTANELKKKMTVLLGGRAAEKLIFGHLSTGAADDLARATDIARGMITRFGMSEKLGSVTYDSEPTGFLGVNASVMRRYSDHTAYRVDLEIQMLVQDAFQEALGILIKHRPVLEEGARQLLARETLTEPELKLLFGQITLESSSEPEGLNTKDQIDVTAP